jgi:hypothetical protein
VPPEEATHNFNSRILYLEFVLPHFPYSPGLVPADFHLSSPLKDALRGRRFSGNDELQQRVHEELRRFSKQL